MSSRLGIAGIVLLAAFGLAACGGGGGGTATAPEPEPTPSGPTPEERAEMVRTEATAAALDAREKGEAAGAAATKALEDATKYTDLLDAVSAKGDSATATSNAQMVLDAQMALTDAIAAAEMAVEAAEAAKEGADAETVESLETAIEVAEENIDAAKVTLDYALKMQVEEVTGTKTDTGYPRAAAYHGTQVAKAVHAALAAPEESAVRATFNQMAGGNEASTSKGYNWGELIEALGLTRRYTRVDRATDSRTPPRQTRGVLGAVVNGQAIPTTADDGTTALDVATITDRGGDTAGVSVTMFGLPGMLYCQVGTCTVKDGKLYGKPFESDDSRTGETLSLVPQWFFVPANSFDDRYVAVSASPRTYMVETGYVRYGYWLDMTTGTPPVLRVNAYAAAAANTNTGGLDLNHPSTGNPTEGATATYSGQAVGLASRLQGIESGKPTYGSGEFTADVSLTAKFSDTAVLEGKVSNFQGRSDAVDSRWSVALGATDLDVDGSFTGGVGTSGTAGTATGDSGEDDGEWRAQGYGTSGKRPSGFFGTFNANFVNGRVAGGYATSRDTE